MKREQPKIDKKQELEMARNNLERVKDLEMTDEEKALTMHLIKEAKAFEAQGNLVKAHKVYLELLTYLKDIKSKQNLPIYERVKETWDWKEGERVMVDWQSLEKLFGQDNMQVPQFTADGERYVTAVKDNDKDTDNEISYLIGDGKKKWPNNFPAIYSYSISRDGESALVGFKQDEEMMGLAVNGEVWPVTFTSIHGFFSPDGKSVIIQGENSVVDHMEKLDNGTEIPIWRHTLSVIIKDKKVILQSEAASYQMPVLNNDNSQYACQVIDEKGWSIIVNGKRWLNNFDEISSASVFSPDSKKVAAVYFEEEEGFSLAINDKKAWANYFEDFGCGPVFSPDGTQIAIGVKKTKDSKGYTIFENDMHSWKSEFENIEDIVYSPDSKNIAAIVEIGPWQRAIAINDQLVPISGHNYVLNIENLTWSPDGKKILFVYRVHHNKPEINKYIRAVVNVEEYLK